MRIKITKNLIIHTQIQEKELIPEALFPEGEIELINTKKIKARFSFSQFREKVSLGEFVVVES
jgi:hypothetical protein